MRVVKVDALKGQSNEINQEVIEAAAKDKSMQTQLGIIKQWPEHKSDKPSEVRSYLDVRDTLSQED